MRDLRHLQQTSLISAVSQVFGDYKPVALIQIKSFSLKSVRRPVLSRVAFSVLPV